MDEIDKSAIFENLNELPTLRNLLSEDWINEELGKNEPSTLILLIKHKEPMIQHLENNLNYLCANEINQHKKHILGLFKGDVGNVYGIISEVEVWTYLKRNNISCTYQPQIDGLEPDFLIKLDQEDIVVEVVSIGEEENIKSKTLREISKKENNKGWHFIVNEVEKYSDCYRLNELLKMKEEKFKDKFKNIIIVNTLLATSGGLWSLKNAVEGYYTLEKDGRQAGYIKYISEDGIGKDMSAFFALKDINRKVNLVVGYHGRINNNCSLYFHNNPYIPFTQKEKESLAKYFLRQIDNAMNGNNVVEVIK